MRIHPAVPTLRSRMPAMQENPQRDVYSERTFCPKCRTKINLRLVRFRSLECPGCGALLDTSRAYTSIVMMLSLVVSLMLANIIHLKAYLAPLWICLLILTFSFVPGIAISVVPPKLILAKPEAGDCQPKELWRRRLNLFLGLWFGGTIFLFGYMYILGWTGVAVTGSTAVAPDVLEMFSTPLAWVNPAFLIRTNSTFLRALGIVFANTFFYAAILTALVTFVRNRMRRSSVLEMGIYGTIPKDEE